jgi:hypothetical protein
VNGREMYLTIIPLMILENWNFMKDMLERSKISNRWVNPGDYETMIPSRSNTPDKSDYPTF